MSSFNFFWNAFFKDPNLMFGIMSRNSLSNASICSHCGGVLFYLNTKSSRWISLSCFSSMKKWALQRIHFTTLSIFLINLIRSGSLDGIGMFFNEQSMPNFSMIGLNTVKCSTNCNKKERCVISSSNVLQLNSAWCRKTEQSQGSIYNHKVSFIHERYSNKTTLSSSMWHLKSVSSETPHLKWSVFRCVHHTQISKRNASCAYMKNWK